MDKAEKESLRFQYWQELKRRALEEAPDLVPGEVKRGPTLDFSIGMSDFKIVAIYNFRLHGDVAVAIACQGERAFENLQALGARKIYFEDDLKMALKVVPHVDNSVLRLKSNITGLIGNRDDWERQHKWMLETIAKFKEYFTPILYSMSRTDSHE